MNRHQQIISIFALGILWVFIEILIDGITQTVTLPLKGMIFTAITILFVVSVRRSADFIGSILILGIIAVIMNAFYFQSIFNSAVYAIGLQIILAEIIFGLIKDFKKASITTGTILMVYTFLHGVVVHNFYIGRNIMTIYENLVYSIFGLGFLNAVSIEFILVLFFVIHLILGGVVGYLFIPVSRRIKNYTAELIE